MGEGENEPESRPDAMPAPDVEPASRARDGITGVPLAIAGREWLLPRLPTYPAFAEVRDRLFEDTQIRGAVEPLEVMKAGWVLLKFNYQLEDLEARDLLLAADPGELAGAVYDALIPAVDPPRGVSDWITSALLLAGLDPVKVPGDMVPHVLHQLESAGRIMPLAEFADVCVVMAKRRRIMEKTGVPTGPNGRANPAS